MLDSAGSILLMYMLRLVKRKTCNFQENENWSEMGKHYIKNKKVWCCEMFFMRANFVERQKLTERTCPAMAVTLPCPSISLADQCIHALWLVQRVTLIPHRDRAGRVSYLICGPSLSHVSVGWCLGSCQSRHSCPCGSATQQLQPWWCP